MEQFRDNALERGSSRADAKMTMTTVSQRTGNKQPTCELVALKPLAEEKAPGETK